MVFISAKRM